MQSKVGELLGQAQTPMRFVVHLQHLTAACATTLCSFVCASLVRGLPDQLCWNGTDWFRPCVCLPTGSSSATACQQLYVPNLSSFAVVCQQPMAHLEH